jgi:hypothetical protein
MRAPPLSSGWLCVLLPFALLPGPGCSDLEDDDLGEVAENEIPEALRGTIAPQRGYLDGKSIEFYRFGTFIPADTTWFPTYTEFPGLPVGKMYVFESALPLPDAGAQFPIVDTLPEQAGYSDFFEVVLVEDPGDVAPNTIKSRATLLRAGYPLTSTGKVVNCPLVGREAALGATSGKALAQTLRIDLWYRGRRTNCFLVDGGAALVGSAGSPAFDVSETPITSEIVEYRVLASVVYAFGTKAYSGADLVSGIPVPGNDVFKAGPSSSSYSPLVKIWDVTVPSDYLVGQVTSVASLFPVEGFTDPRIVERSPDAFCNCPIVTAGK